MQTVCPVLRKGKSFQLERREIWILNSGCAPVSLYDLGKVPVFIGSLLTLARAFPSIARGFSFLVQNLTNL